MSPFILTIAILGGTLPDGGYDGTGGGSGGGAEVIDAGSAVGGGPGGGSGGGNDATDGGQSGGGGGSMTGGGTGGGLGGGTGGGGGIMVTGGGGGIMATGGGGGIMATGGGGGIMATGGGGGIMATGGGGGIMATGGGIGGGTGGGGTVLPLVPNDVWASLAAVGNTNAAVAVWVDDRRDTSFGDARRRGGDLWVNAWTADGGVSAPFGALLCPTSARETLSEPRVAVSAAGATVIAWRVATEGVAGHSLRVATWTSSAGLSSCNDVLVDGDGVALSSPQLKESNNEFLLVWETPSAVMGQFVTSPVQPAFVISSKVGTADERAFPSLTATADGFFAAWTQGGGFWGAGIPNVSSGQGARSAQHYFSLFPPLTSATAAAPPLTGAFISSLNGQPPRVFASRLDNATIPSPTVGPETGAHPLVAASLRGTVMRLFVAHQTADATGFLVTEFGLQPHSVPLAAGLEPLSMVADDQRALLLLGNATTLSVQPILPGLLGTAPSLGPGVATRSEPNQLRHSAVWTDGGAWLVGWNENTTSFGGFLSPQTGGLTSAGPPVQDGGIRLLSQVAAGDGVAVSVITRTDTRLFREEVNSPGNGTLLLTAPGERPIALVGEQIAALWSLGEEVAVIGQGTPQPLGFPGARLGRCGAWADGSLWIPLLDAAGDLAVLEAVDSAAGAAPTVHNLGPLPRSALPCLVARGTDLLLLSHDGESGILVAMTNVNDVRAGKPPIILPLPAQPGARPVLDPVAAPNARGWQVAWESPDELGSVILGMKLDLLGNPTDGNALALGVDERAPVLVPSAGGAVALVYQHFSDRTGNVVIKIRVLAAEPLPQPDGGVSDGGLADGGLADGDGGFDVLGPVTYDTCGCQSGGASAVLGLLLLVIFGRRRASTRS